MLRAVTRVIEKSDGVWTGRLDGAAKFIKRRDKTSFGLILDTRDGKAGLL